MLIFYGQITINYSGQSIYKAGRITTILDFKYGNMYLAQPK